MTLAINQNWQRLVNATRSEIRDFPNSASLIDLFLEHVPEVNQSILLLAKLILIIRKNTLPDSKLEKIHQAFNQTIHIKRNREIYLISDSSQSVFQLNQTELECQTLLTFACMYCELDIIREIAKKQDLNETNKAGLTPLMVACEKGRSKVAFFLLDKGANKDIATPNKRTALHCACQSGCIEVVKRLVAADNLNLQTRQGITPLMIACIKGQSQVALFLLDIKAKREIATPTGRTALHYACLGGCIHVVKKMVESCDINLPTKAGVTPLMIACANDRPEVAYYLMAKGAKRGSVDSRGKNALHYACSGGCLESVKVLVTSENINQANKTGCTLLMAACTRGRIGVAQYLLDQGAKRDLVQSDGRTALHRACQNGHLEAVKILAAPENINLLTKDEMSPLMLSLLHQHFNISIYLIEQGALLQNADADLVEKNVLPHFLEKFEKMPRNSSLFSKINIIRPFLEVLYDSDELAEAKLEIIKLYLEKKEPIKTAQSLLKQLEKEKDEKLLRLSIDKTHQFLKELLVIIGFFREIIGSPPSEVRKMRRKLSQALEKIKMQLSLKDVQDREKLKERFKDKDIYQILFEWGIGGQPGEQDINSLYQKHLGIDDPSYLYSVEVETGCDLIEKVGIDNELEILCETKAHKEEMLGALNRKIEKAEQNKMAAGELISARELFEKSDPGQEVRLAEQRFNSAALRSYLTKT